MSEDAKDLRVQSALDRKDLVNRLMKKQGALSLRIAAVFVALLIGVPLFNLYEPGLAATSEFGFTLAWLLLGVIFFPITWVLSAYFVKESNALESQIANDERSHSVVANLSEKTPS